jgi:twitching motility protein PilT
MIAGTIKGVISQRLVPGADGGRVAVCEILRMTGRARDMVLDPDQTERLREVIAEGAYYGMQTFDQALLKHYQAGRVAMEDALRVASSPHDFKLLVAGDGRTSTSMEDVGGPSPEPRPETPAPAPRRPAPTVPAAGPARNGSAPPPGVAA